MENFYYDFRCGILHQAEIGRKSRVWSISKLVEFYPDGMTVNRTKFHFQLKGAIDDYIADLGKPLLDLRTRFRKKMDYICRN